MGDTVPPPLTQGVGYGVVVGLGVAFALGMVWTTKRLKKSFGEDDKSTETFMVANRSIGTGLTASAVISSWTYTSALLGSVYLTYWYGIALPIWWANGQSVMICFFAVLAIQAKLKCPNAHTLLEIIKVRYGTTAHVLWVFLCLVNNLFGFASMLVGAAASVSALTGVHIIASTYLLPLGVVVYTYFGGLRATFLTDYIHTFIIMIILVWFTIQVIMVDEIGSIGGLYDAIMRLPASQVVEGNHKGSYLTMTSEESVVFGIIHIVTNFGIGFAADVAAAVPGYILGGNAYFSIPWAFGTIVGLAALVLENTPGFPTYPRRMTHTEVANGLVLPYVSQAVAGKGGAAAILLILFMACTSVSSAQLIAVSSILSFDVYKPYFNPKATDKQLIKWSHYGVIGFSLIASSFATALHQGGVDLNWLFYMLGIVICPGTFPTCFSLLWDRQTKAAAIISPIVGMISGFVVWFGLAYRYSGTITIASLGGSYPCMFACVTSMFVPLPLSIAISYMQPSRFDFKKFRQIELVNGSTDIQMHGDEVYFTPERVKYMKRMSIIAAIWAAATFAGHVLLWPLPMYGARTVFSRSPPDIDSEGQTPVHGPSFRRQKRQASVYDAVAGRLNAHGFLPSAPYASKYRDTTSSSFRPVRPEEVLFRRQNAPVRYEESDFYFAHETLPSDRPLPSSDLLESVHAYSADFYDNATQDHGHDDYRSMDETALIAMGILIEEMAAESLGETGDLVLVEGEPISFEDNQLSSQTARTFGRKRANTGQSHILPSSGDDLSSVVKRTKRSKKRRLAHQQIPTTDIDTEVDDRS
ncbi:hypothetical protein FE257_005430 [Aspergillus nanangensis]|uniref:Sodium/solute symporter n=1 Tax=Aspergillus nanangensis TaxID=2582783 RepID=A0AAD4CQI2_ASPNN|nr:hypothetical protein FE257_005430 [Aspergillus nanangensis]